MQLEELSSGQGAIADIFSTEAIQEMDSAQQQTVFTELLQYNMKYLEEKEKLEQQQVKN